MLKQKTMTFIADSLIKLLLKFEPDDFLCIHGLFNCKLMNAGKPNNTNKQKKKPGASAPSKTV